jgi:hypothetical protein
MPENQAPSTNVVSDTATPAPVAETPASSQAMGSVVLRVKWPTSSRLIPPDVNKYVVYVSGPDFTPITRTITAPATTDTFMVLSGSNRIFKVDAQNSDGTSLLVGVKNANIVAGSVNRVAINLTGPFEPLNDSDPLEMSFVTDTISVIDAIDTPNGDSWDKYSFPVEANETYSVTLQPLDTITGIAYFDLYDETSTQVAYGSSGLSYSWTATAAGVANFEVYSNYSAQFRYSITVIRGAVPTQTEIEIN